MIICLSSPSYQSGTVISDGVTVLSAVSYLLLHNLFSQTGDLYRQSHAHGYDVLGFSTSDRPNPDGAFLGQSIISQSFVLGRVCTSTEGDFHTFLEVQDTKNLCSSHKLVH